MHGDRVVGFISGATRGIGFALTSLLAQRDDVLIFAGARDPANALPLQELAEKTGKVIPVKLEAANEADAAALVKLVEQKAGKVDVLVNNAGIAEDFNKPVLATPPASFTKQFTVNALGALVLFQHLHPLLIKSSSPRFFAITSSAGSTGSIALIPLSLAAYGSSKAALNHLVAHIAREHGEKDNLIATLHGEKDGLVAAVVHPGFVGTDMAKAAMEAVGLTLDAQIPGIQMLTPDESAAALVKIYDEAKRETHGGRFFSYDGSQIPW
uniref:Short-chain dehydrogenase/reductase SDR family protein n=1 Tax=Rhodotorula toruloides TaxID=5286 RepID=A0A0K3CE54_RHOTO